MAATKTPKLTFEEMEAIETLIDVADNEYVAGLQLRADILNNARDKIRGLIAAARAKEGVGAPPKPPKVEIVEHGPVDDTGLVTMVFRAMIPTPKGRRLATFSAVYRHWNPADYSVSYHTQDFYQTNGAACTIPHEARVEAARQLQEAAVQRKAEARLAELVR